MDLADAYEHNDIITDTCESSKLMMYNDVDWGSHEPVDAVNKCRVTTPKKNTKKKPVKYHKGHAKARMNKWNHTSVIEQEYDAESID